MSELVFRVIDVRRCSAPEWFAVWAARYEGDELDRSRYQELIDKGGQFTAEDMVKLGKWKDDVSDSENNGRWKSDVASVAFKIWEELANNPPVCPVHEEVEAFLEELSQREYTDKYSSGLSRKKHFGLSRATTVLHFLSSGHYPILDSRVWTAVGLLAGPRMSESSKSYVADFLPFFDSLKKDCGTDNTRELDKALFAYGSSLEMEGVRKIVSAT